MKLGVKMNGMYNPIIFYPTAVLIILFAVLAIKFKNIFYSLLSAIGVFFLAGILFYILGSEYNAVIQIAIYGVAVPVVLGLAVMFTDLRKKDNSEVKISNFKYIMFLMGGLFVLALVYLTMTSMVMSSVGFNQVESIGNTSIQVMNAFARGLFVKYVWAFELVSVILTMIVVGLTFFNKKEEK